MIPDEYKMQITDEMVATLAFDSFYLDFKGTGLWMFQPDGIFFKPEGEEIIPLRELLEQYAEPDWEDEE